ncbi:MAG: TIGR04255 family protein [Jatrophihabitantaceae bacterium]
MAYDLNPVFFDAPPVAEVALSIQTTPVPRLQTADMSVFWDRFLRAEYPHTQDQPAAPPMIERFDSDALMPSVVFGFGGPLGRQWYLSEDQTQLVQLQNDRLVVNWRRLSSQGYPHYKTLRENIERIARQWSDYLEVEGFQAQKVVQAEVTYINQLPVEEPLSSLSDLGALFAALRPEWPAQMGRPELVQLEQRFVVDAPGEKRARMYLAVAPAILEAGHNGLTINLVVRGAPADTSLEGVLAWLDFAHNQVVNSFADITTSAMRQKWRQHDGTSDKS